MANIPTDPSSWLIRAKDAEGKTIYYAGDGAFIDDPAWALKFPTQKAAELRSMGLTWSDIETLEAA